jgi:CheY-like chemotaxis protein
MMDLPQLVPQPGVPLPSRRILLVDDNDDARELMAIVLEMHGHKVAMAADGAAGLVRAQDFMPDIVFLDLGMPVMDGYETAVALRCLAGLETVWIVALSGWSDQATLARTHAAGFDYHLTKPANFAIIDNFLYGDWTRLSR